MLRAIRQVWLNPRSSRFWLIFSLLGYTFAGFFVAPNLIKQAAIDYVEQRLNRQLNVELVAVNPFALSVEVRNVVLVDPDGVTLVGFEALYLNLQLSSILRRAWTVDELTLKGPSVLFERFAEGDTRFSRLLQADEFLGASTEPVAGALPAITVSTLSIDSGRLQIVDHVPKELVRTEFAPVDITVMDLSTIPDQQGLQTVQIALPGGGSLAWSGELALAPFHSNGRLVMEAMNPRIIRPYVQRFINIDDIHGVVSADFAYQLDLGAGGTLSARIDDLSVAIEQLAVLTSGQKVPVLAIDAISLSQGKFLTEERQMSVGKVEIDGAKARLTRLSGGQLDIPQLMIAPGPDSYSAEAAGERNNWQVQLSELDLTNGALEFVDHNTSPTVKLEIDLDRLSATSLTNYGDVRGTIKLQLGLSDGTLILEGGIGAHSQSLFEGSLSAARIPFAQLSPYLGKVLDAEIETGYLSGDFDLTVPHNLLPVLMGSVELHDLRIVDNVDNEKLLAWDQLRIDRIELAESSLQLSVVRVEQPYLKLAIDESGELNLQNLLLAAEGGKESDVVDSATATSHLMIGQVLLNRAMLDFSDLSLPLPFQTTVSNLSGNVSTISSNSREPASIRLEGQVNEYGYSQINGSLTPFNLADQTAIELSFKNLTVSNYSPYTASFAGREIATGKLELSLTYEIDKGQLEGNHQIVVSELTLGEKVDHPDVTSLPLGLAVSLLKDAGGVIDIELPVSGNMNDPEFELGDAILKVFTNLVSKIVTAPFKVLGSLVGLSDEDIGEIEFEPGRSDLTPPAIERIGKLVSSLGQRPELRITVPGRAFTQIDGPALQQQALREEVIARLGESYNPGLSMLDEKIVGVLEILFEERLPDNELAQFRTQYQSENSGFDRVSYIASLRDQLLTSFQISEQQLIALADARAHTIGSALSDPKVTGVNQAGTSVLAPQRVVIGSSTIDLHSVDGISVLLGVE